jgi:hypothetical protein
LELVLAKAYVSAKEMAGSMKDWIPAGDGQYQTHPEYGPRHANNSYKENHHGG